MKRRSNYLDYHMTHQEIADELGVSRATYAIECSALQKLKRSGKLRTFWSILTMIGRIIMGRGDTQRYVRNHKPRCKSSVKSHKKSGAKKKRGVVQSSI